MHRNFYGTMCLVLAKGPNGTKLFSTVQPELKFIVSLNFGKGRELVLFFNVVPLNEHLESEHESKSSLF
jgi:hypothetical protein